MGVDGGVQEEGRDLGEDEDGCMVVVVASISRQQRPWPIIRGWRGKL